MSIKLEVISDSAEQLENALEVSDIFEKISIGRKEDNSLILADPKKYISNHHAEIEYQDSHYIISDLSANGVFINGSSIPLGQNNPQKLNDGDTIKIGEYNIAVVITLESKNLVEAQDEDPLADLKITSDEQSFDSIDSWSDRSIDEIINSTEPDLELASSQEESKSVNEAVLNQVPEWNESFTPPENISTRQDHHINDIDNVDDPLISNHTVNSNPKPSRPEKNPQPHKNEEEHLSVSEDKKSPRQNDLDIVEQFLHGAGLESNLIKEHLHTSSFFLIGEMLRTMLQGTMDVLKARDNFKSEMRLDVTTIKPMENNPIKFSANVEEALCRLIIPKRDGYMTADHSIEEAFHDIKDHQVAILVGLQSALQSVLQSFDPKILQQQLEEKGSFAINIPYVKQAKLWKLFKQTHSQLDKDIQDDFNRIFGQAFADAYLKQIKELKTKNN